MKKGMAIRVISWTIFLFSLLLIIIFSLAYVSFIGRNIPQYQTTSVRLANYDHGRNLCIQISANPNNITTTQNSTLIIKVTSNGIPISNASVELNCSAGSLSIKTGKTDMNGELVALFSSCTPGIFTINALASKSGYKSSFNFTKVNVLEKYAQKMGVVINNGVIPVDACMCMSRGPLFIVYGLPRSPYLRVSVGEIYRSGFWYSTIFDSKPYTNELVFIPDLDSDIWDLKIVPMLEIGGFIPVIRETLKVETNYELTRFPSAMTFYLNGTTSKPYTIMYVPEYHDEKLLLNAKCVKDPKMLQLPDSITNRTRELAINITKGINGDYQRTVAIKDFLVKNYIYDKNYTAAPKGWDPIDWFLFEEKRGICTIFNSAFVILCRIVGIPSRVVWGYLISTDALNQTVTACQAHAWAEVKFEEIGWVTFDATGRGSEIVTNRGKIAEQKMQNERIKIVTMINSQPSIAIRGDRIHIRGTVKTINGSDVSGLRIFIYLLKDKNLPGVIIGESNVTNGAFDASCVIPYNQTIGNFLVVAKTTNNEQYIGSTSDPLIKVMRRSSLSIKAPEFVSIYETFNITGMLLENETSLPISDAKLNIKIGEESHSAKTDSDGYYWLSTSIESPGNYTICVSYLGDDFTLPSQVEYTIKVIPVKLDWEANTKIIRNERWDSKGSVTKGNKGIEGIEVILSLDEKEVLNNMTDLLGNFILSYHIPKNTSLGPHDAYIMLPYYKLGIHKFVSVFAKTRICAKFPDKVEEGKYFLVNVSLLDDLDNPIVNQKLRINMSSKAGDKLFEEVTKEKEFSINLIAPKESNVDIVNVKIEFTGSNYYLASEASKSIKVLHPSPSYFMIFMSLGIVIPILFISIFFFKRKKEKTKEHEVKIEEHEPMEKLKICLSFPSIHEPFPLVWGVNEILPLNVSCRDQIPQGSKLELILDGEPFLSNECKNEQSFTLKFKEKGMHSIEVKVICEGKEISSLRQEIKIVDYAEEINLMHNIIVSEMERINITFKQNLTLREEMAIILRDAPNIHYESLNELYSEFEKVDYSLKSISRKDYEIAYLAFLSIKNDISSILVSSK
jgi:hypothetical protein